MLKDSNHSHQKILTLIIFDSIIIFNDHIQNIQAVSTTIIMYQNLATVIES